MSGIILYEGPSMLTGEPIVAILTNCEALGHRRSANPKTGPMGQVWVLEQNRTPGESRRLDTPMSAICGDCPLRGTVCYVNVMGPSSVWKKWARGGYRAPTENEVEAIRSAPIRWGAYGDPCALPASVMATYSGKADTGYTHLWRMAKAQWAQPYVMASVESEQDALEAIALGWRTFRITDGPARMSNELVCPSETRGKTCYACGLCNGTAGKARKSITIPVHGPQASNFRG